MSGFNGRWKRVSSSNVDAVIKASGCNAQQSATMKALFSDADVIEDFKVTATGTHREVIVNGDLTRAIDSTFGKPQEVDTVFGISTLTTVLVSDTRIELRETPSGRPSSLTVLTLVDEKIKMEYTVNDVTCQRTFVKQ